MWLCDTETEVLLWLTGMWNYSQVCFTSYLFTGDKFYCLDMLILVYRASTMKLIKKKIHKASHKGVNLISTAILYSAPHLKIWLIWILGMVASEDPLEDSCKCRIEQLFPNI